MVKPLTACAATRAGSAQQQQPQQRPYRACNSTALSAGATAALHFWLVRNPCSKNWFFNQIQGPSILGQTMLLMQHSNILPNETLSLADVDLLRGASWWKGWSGMNLAALATLQIYRGLLFSSAPLVKEGFAAVWSQLAPMDWPPPPASKTAAVRFIDVVQHRPPSPTLPTRTLVGRAHPMPHPPIAKLRPHRSPHSLNILLFFMC